MNDAPAAGCARGEERGQALTQAGADRRVPDIPRELVLSCPHCGGVRHMLNGLYYRRLRLLAKLTLTDMARICASGGHEVSYSHLGKMERGAQPFLEVYGQLYDSLFERRRRSGDDDLA